MSPPMTSETWRSGSRSLAIVVLGAGFLIGPLALCLSLALDSPLFLTLLFLFAVGSTLCYVAYLIVTIRNRVRAGRVLLDCGPTSMRWLYWLTGAMFLTYGTVKILGFNTDGEDPLEFWIHVWFIIFSSFHFVMALGRLQVRDQGIWQHGQLIKWGRFESYDWTGDRGCTLTYQYKSWLPFLGEGAVAFRPEHQQAVDDLLEAHAARATNDQRAGMNPS